MDWYRAEDEQRSVRQLVLDDLRGGAQEPEFGSLGLSRKYENLLSGSWCAGWFRTDAQPGPFLLVRADGRVELFRACPLRVAFSFFREPAGGLLGIFVAGQDESLRAASPTGLGVVEIIYGLDDPDIVGRIRDGLARDALHICFADASTGMSMEVLDASGGIRELTPPQCRFDRIFPLPQELRSPLLREFDELLEYHRRLPTRKRDYIKSMRQLEGDFQADADPILTRPTQNLQGSEAGAMPTGGPVPAVEDPSQEPEKSRPHWAAIALGTVVILYVVYAVILAIIQEGI